jgi:hypothetical protein
VESSVIALSTEDASELFNKAAQRLLNISKWHTLPCSLLSGLKLRDQSGLEVVDRQVRENDFFVVNPDEGDGEWVKVEKIVVHRDPAGPREVVTVRARPSSDPFNNEEESNRPSNTFKITRNGRNITATVYGQNEEDRLLSNDNDVARPDSTVGAIHGVARVQWRSLVNGILSTWKE